MPSQETAVTPRAAQDALERLLAERRAQIAEVARANIDPDQVFNAVLHQVSRSDDLMRIAMHNPLSIYRAIHRAVSWGLEPTGAVGGAHLVSYGDEADVIADYRGLIKLARRSGEVTKVIARVVREQDRFEVKQGTTEELIHVPFLEGDAGAPTHVYTVITYRDGTSQFDWDTWAWVQSIKRRSRARSGPWSTDEVEMAKKSIIRRGLKLAPQAVDVQHVIVYEEEQEAARASLPAQAATTASAADSRIAQIQARVSPRPVAVEPVEEPVSVEAAQQATGAAMAEAIGQAVDRVSEPPQQSVAKARKSRSPSATSVPDATTAQRPALAASDEDCGAVPPSQLGMTEPCLLRGEHRVHRSSEGTWPA